MVAPSGLPITAQRAGADARPPALPVAQDRIRLGVGWSSEASRAAILAWLDAGLRPGRPGRLEREYPLLFAPGSAAIPICLLEGDAPAAFCLLWPSSFSLGSGVLRSGLVSLVYTDPAYRRRGLARRAVGAAVDAAIRQGLGLVLLWSELEELYRAQGFCRAGVETLLVVDGPILARARARAASISSSITVDLASAADWPAILELRRARSCSVALADPAGRLAAIPGLDVRVARRAGRVVGFAMRGRGDDFEGVVHEWGGEVEGMLACCGAWARAEDPASGFLLLSPKAASPVTLALRQAGARVVSQPLAFARIASLPAFEADLASVCPDFAKRRLRRPDAPIDDAPSLVVEDVEAGTRVQLSEASFLDALLGHVSEAAMREARQRLAPVLPPELVESLPLPFFVWGLESI